MCTTRIEKELVLERAEASSGSQSLSVSPAHLTVDATADGRRATTGRTTCESSVLLLLYGSVDCGVRNHPRSGDDLQSIPITPDPHRRGPDTPAGAAPSPSSNASREPWGHPHTTPRAGRVVLRFTPLLISTIPSSRTMIIAGRKLLPQVITVFFTRGRRERPRTEHARARQKLPVTRHKSQDVSEHAASKAWRAAPTGAPLRE